MPVFKEGKVAEVHERRGDLLRARVDTEDGELEAAGFASMLGDLAPGDRVVLNTTGVDLDLGTGGIAFVLWNLDGPPPEPRLAGHIVKMRYTPWQTEVLAAEAPESEYHDALRDVTSIDGTPVVVCGLHSQVAGVAAGIKAQSPDARVGYLMTDGAALPLAWSDLIHDLKRAGLVDVTCTAGHAFGGDLEAVNVFSGMAALVVAGKADAIVAAMGPGVVGTGTALGFTALEQGQLLDAVAVLGGRPVACLRISFADERPRHWGVSHHSLTALGLTALTGHTVALPVLDGTETTPVPGPPEPDTVVLDRGGPEKIVWEQLQGAGITERHEVVDADGSAGLALLRARGVRPTSMGRTVDDVPELFLAAAAAGKVAGTLI